MSGQHREKDRICSHKAASHHIPEGSAAKLSLRIVFSYSIQYLPLIPKCLSAPSTSAAASICKVFKDSNRQQSMKDIVRQHSYSLTAETFKTASVRHWTFDFGFQTIVFVNKYTRIRIFAVPSKSRIYFLIEPSTCTIRVRNNQIAGTRRGRKYLPWTPEI